MWLKSIYLKDFRNFSEEWVRFTEKENCIAGKNGQGKTNLLEAIILLSIGRSFRTQHVSEAIRTESSRFYLEAELEKEGLSHRIRLSFDGQTKQLQIDGESYAQFSPLLGLLPSVLYAPRDADLVSGSPAERRRFLDLHLAQSDLLYVHHLTRFFRAMRQRNCLLRTKRLDGIDAWEAEMAHAATFIQSARKNLVEALKPLLSEMSHKISQDIESHQMAFHPSYPGEEGAYLDQLQKNRHRDQELRLTGTGPHRDDLSFSIEGRPARLFASEGQKQTTVAALKLAEWHHLSRTVHEPPILAVDDFGAPLDEKRRERLLELFQELGQVFITAPSFGKKEASIQIEEGTIVTPASFK
jgi:DNA replication and repair protein RecF